MSELTGFEKPHFIYVIAHESAGGGITGPVKIGITSNPDARLATLKTASPKPLDIAFVFVAPNKEYARDIEAAFHKIRAKDRLHGEWFNLSPLMAVELMCMNMRAFLEREMEVPYYDMYMALDLTGVTLAEQKCQAERYLRAWEGLAAA